MFALPAAINEPGLQQHTQDTQQVSVKCGCNMLQQKHAQACNICYCVECLIV
jgi:hypothetical protein